MCVCSFKPFSKEHKEASQLHARPYSSDLLALMQIGITVLAQELKSPTSALYAHRLCVMPCGDLQQSSHGNIAEVSWDRGAVVSHVVLLITIPRFAQNVLQAFPLSFIFPLSKSRSSFQVKYGKQIRDLEVQNAEGYQGQ